MEIVLLCLFVLGLLCHIYTDIKEMLLYDIVSLVLLVAGCIYAYYYGDVLDSLYGFFAAGGGMLLLYYLSKGGMGEGDVKLAFVLGVWLGFWNSIICLFLAFISGGLFGSVLLIMRRKSGCDRMPFGPFLCLGGIVAQFYGQKLFSRYLGYF